MFTRIEKEHYPFIARVRFPVGRNATVVIYSRDGFTDTETEDLTEFYGMKVEADRSRAFSLDDAEFAAAIRWTDKRGGLIVWDAPGMSAKCVEEFAREQGERMELENFGYRDEDGFWVWSVEFSPDWILDIEGVRDYLGRNEQRWTLWEDFRKQAEERGTINPLRFRERVRGKATGFLNALESFGAVRMGRGTVSDGRRMVRNWEIRTERVRELTGRILRTTNEEEDENTVTA